MPLQRMLLAAIALVIIPPSESQCGVRQIVKTDLIVNGQQTAPGEWPWHTAIYHKGQGKKSYEYVCGGTLISEQFVLTAAHCVIAASNGFQVATNRIFVRLGVHDLEELDPQTLQQHRVQRIYTTGNYTGPAKKDDIALIELSTLAVFNNFVQPACLNGEPELTGVYGTAIGWGVTEDDTVSTVLRKAEMPAIDTISCLQSNRVLFGQTLTDGIFCAGYQNGTTVCNGDSGGGLFFKQKEAWYVGGVVSFSAFRDKGGLCFTKGYAAFTNVSYFLPWIYGITKLQLGQTTVTNQTKLPEECGQSIVERIPQGNTTRVFAYPWMAQLRSIQDRESWNKCDGTLINSRYVLTSAYCISNEQAHKNEVWLGEHTMHQSIDCNVYTDSKGVEIDRKCAGLVEIFDIELFVTHPLFEDYPKAINNIGLIRLSRDVVMKDHIRPVCLPVTPQLRSLQLYRYVAVSWGPYLKQSVTQKTETVPWVSIADCQQEWKDEQLKVINDQHLCARDQLAQGCLAANGAPLGFEVNYNGDRFVQFGVFSVWYATRNCGITNVPSVYTRVGDQMDWILANIKL